MIPSTLRMAGWKPSKVSPTSVDVEYARLVVEAWRQAEAAGRGSLDLNGRMVDVPVVKRAQSLLAQVEAIAQQRSS